MIQQKSRDAQLAFARRRPNGVSDRIAGLGVDEIGTVLNHPWMRRISASSSSTTVVTAPARLLTSDSRNSNAWRIPFIRWLICEFSVLHARYGGLIVGMPRADAEIQFGKGGLGFAQLTGQLHERRVGSDCQQDLEQFGRRQLL